MATPTCRELAAAAGDDAMWTARLHSAACCAVQSLVTPRRDDPRLLASEEELEHIIELVRARALSMAHKAASPPASFRAPHTTRMTYFYALPQMATAAVEVLKCSSPQLCLISFASRAYDTTDFVERHPGGSDHMQRYHGQDATPICAPAACPSSTLHSLAHYLATPDRLYSFLPLTAPRLDSMPARPSVDAFQHSPRAHDMMQREMLRFDAIAHVGRFGAPRTARHVLPLSWSLSRDVEDACKASAAAVYTSTAHSLSEMSRHGRLIHLVLLLATLMKTVAWAAAWAY